MKKKIIIALLLLIPFISIIFVILFRGVIMPSNEEIISSLKDINAYKCEVEYITKNSKGIEKEVTSQYYSKEKGVRVEYGDDLVKIYKQDNICVKDKKNNSEINLNKEMDIVHTLAFMNTIFSYPIKADSIAEGQEEWGDVVYIQADVELYLNNIYLNKARIFINKADKTPIGIVVYDDQGNDTMRIVYKNFEKVKNVDESMF